MNVQRGFTKERWTGDEDNEENGVWGAHLGVKCLYPKHDFGIILGMKESIKV
jgi:hypothetical protein